MIAHGHSFSIYSKIAEKEGGKLTVRNQKEADRALISVSPGISVHLGCESQRNEVVQLEEAQRRGTGSTPILGAEEVEELKELKVSPLI